MKEALMRTHALSRREFARIATSTAAVLAGGPAVTAYYTLQQPVAPTTPKPDALKSEFLMDLELETGGAGSGSVGTRSIVAVNGGTFDGPRLRGRVVPPGADWPITAGDGLRILDVRTVLMTDDDQRIYVTYRGVIYTPPTGQSERYWRITPAFETAAEKYAR
jgi:hypothetical protein